MTDVREEPISNLPLHGEISVAFSVTSTLDVSLADDGLGGFVLTEVPVAEPWTKDYDAIKGEGPARWATRFDVSRWGLLAAYDGERRVGGAVIAFDTAELYMLRGRTDLAMVWDIRVAQADRAAGTGTMLFRAAEAWARERSCRTLEIETQNINVPACRFYRRMGCTLAAIHRFAYSDLPDEVQLIWRREL